MTILFVTFGIVGLGVGLGAAFPKFKFENVTQIAGSSGGVLYMMAASTFVATVLFLEAFPAYFYLSAQYRGVPLDSRGVMVIAGALSVIVVFERARRLASGCVGAAAGWRRWRFESSGPQRRCAILCLRLSAYRSAQALRGSLPSGSPRNEFNIFRNFSLDRARCRSAGQADLGAKRIRMSFNQLGLSVELLRAVDAQGYKHPTPVQSLAIPPILLGGDLMARAQTGTGKTAGFTLPLLQRLSESSRGGRQKRHLRALILTPDARACCSSARERPRVRSLSAFVLHRRPSAASAFVRRSRR